jgi:predicted DNA-binding transcriptional regulator AlpA
MISERQQLGEKKSAQMPLLTLDRVAELLGVSKAWVRDHATRRNPRLPVVRLGGKRAILRFRPQDIENFIDAHLQVQEGGV